MADALAGAMVDAIQQLDQLGWDYRTSAIKSFS